MYSLCYLCKTNLPRPKFVFFFFLSRQLLHLILAKCVYVFVCVYVFKFFN